VQKCAAIARLVLAQLGRIDEKAIARGEQQPDAKAFRGGVTYSCYAPA